MPYMKPKLPYFCLLCLTLNALVACAAPPPVSTPLPAPTFASPPTPRVTAFITTAPTLPATATAPVPATPTTIPPTPASLEPAPAAWSELESWLTAAWQSNTPPSLVQQALQQTGWQSRQSHLQAFDLDGDSRDEWLVTLYALPNDPIFNSGGYGDLGQFWIVNSQGVPFRIDRMASLFEAAPEVVTVADFTGDNRYEVVVQSTSCGAHTCFQAYEIISAHWGGWQNLVQRADAPTETAAFIHISSSDAATLDTNGDGVYDFVVHGGAIGSAGAGIHRQYTEVWRWNGAHMALAEITWDETNYRHHHLYAGNEALAAGNIEQAVDLYLSVIEDKTLIDVPAFVGDGDSYDDSLTFAAFRLALIALRQGDLIQATTWDGWLQLVYPGHPLTEAVSLMIQTWESSQDLTAACAAVTAFLSGFAQPTGVLENLGYGNPSLTAADVCPAP